MNTLLIIDPQNDFCTPSGTLFVPGADEDMARLARLLRTRMESFSEIVVTLDSHPSVAIERPTFWMRGNGQPVKPFTEITQAQVAAGEYSPRNPALRNEVLAYTKALEAQGRYRLMVWPVHCVTGTWGHNIHDELVDALGDWEVFVQHGAFKVLKGQNPLTEQYSAVRAEVPLPDDATTQTNYQLIAKCRPGAGLLLVGGEAASHCVAATLEHLFDEFTPDEIKRVVLLSDCMSAVKGFENHADDFYALTLARGARLLTSEQAAAELNSSN
jgi:nicotinamidase/pyrazinamidase